MIDHVSIKIDIDLCWKSTFKAIEKISFLLNILSMNMYYNWQTQGTGGDDVDHNTSVCEENEEVYYAQTNTWKQKKINMWK